MSWSHFLTLIQKLPAEFSEIFWECSWSFKWRVGDPIWPVQHLSRCSRRISCILQCSAVCPVYSVQCAQCAVCPVYSVQCAQSAQCAVCPVYSVQCAQSAQCAGRSYYRRGCGVRGSSHQPPQPTPRSKESQAFFVCFCTILNFSVFIGTNTSVTQDQFYSINATLRTKSDGMQYHTIWLFVMVIWWSVPSSYGRHFHLPDLAKYFEYLAT